MKRPHKEKTQTYFILNSVTERFTAVDSQPSLGTVTEHRFIKLSLESLLVFSP